MSALGSSVVNKSVKKFAPKKAPTRRPADAPSTRSATRSSIERQSQTSQDQPAQSRNTASPVPSISTSTPAPSLVAHTLALTTVQHDTAPTPILIPSRELSVARTPSVQPVVPQKRSLERPQTSEVLANVTPTPQVAPTTMTIPSTVTIAVSPVRSGSTPTPLPGPTAIDGPVAKRRKTTNQQNQKVAPTQASSQNDPNFALPTTETGEEAGEEGENASTRLAKKKATRMATAEKRTELVGDAAARSMEKRKAKAKRSPRYRGIIATQGQEAEPEEIQIVVNGAAGESSQIAATTETKKTRKPAKGKGKQAIEDLAAAIVQDAAQGTSKKRGRRSKRAATPDGAENIRIDASEVKMFDLAKDGGTGRRSSADRKIREKEREAFLKKKQEKLQQIMGQVSKTPETGPVESRLDRLDRERRKREEGMGNIVPQQVIVNGEIVIDTSSLRIDRHALAAIELAAEGPVEVVEEDEYTRKINYGLGVKRDKSGAWNESLTDRFYEGLRMFGTDFGMISKMFPGKTRHSIKLKFCKEEKEDGLRIRAALLGDQLSVELEQFQEMTGQVYEDPAILAHDMENDKKRLEEEQEQEKEAIEAARRERAEQAEAERLVAQGEESSSKENRRKKRKGGKSGKKRRDRGEKEKGKGKGKGKEKSSARTKTRKAGMLEAAGEGTTQKRVTETT